MTTLGFREHAQRVGDPEAEPQVEDGEEATDGAHVHVAHGRRERSPDTATIEAIERSRCRSSVSRSKYLAAS